MQEQAEGGSWQKTEEIKSLNELIMQLEDKVRAQFIDLKSFQRQVTTLTNEIRFCFYSS